MRFANLFCIAVASFMVLDSSLAISAIVTFRDGVNGSSKDTWLTEGDPDTDRGGMDRVGIDIAPGEDQGLLRFDNIFGINAGQIPLNSIIINATLRIRGYPGGADLESTTLHQMLIPWQESSTWTSLVDGIDPNDGEAKTTAVAEIFGPWEDEEVREANVTESLAAWSQGESNFGWVFLPTGTNDDGWNFYSRENVESKRPELTVRFVVPEPCTAMLGLVGLLYVLCWRRAVR